VLAVAESFTHWAPEKVNNLPNSVWLDSEVAALGKNLNLLFQTKNTYLITLIKISRTFERNNYQVFYPISVIAASNLVRSVGSLL
jgi:hypothetical protein